MILNSSFGYRLYRLSIFSCFWMELSRWIEVIITRKTLDVDGTK